MIKLTSTNGEAIFLAPAAIAAIHEAGASSQWHGIKAFVKTFDGKTIEVREEANWIAEEMKS